MSNPDYGNRALDGAFNKGKKARTEGKPIAACPYPDRRTYHGNITFSRAFIRAWINGWKDASEGEADDGRE